MLDYEATDQDYERLTVALMDAFDYSPEREAGMEIQEARDEIAAVEREAAAELAALARLKQKYPNACERCWGLGHIGGAIETECPDCVEKGICPLCGGMLHIRKTDDLYYCAECAWNEVEHWDLALGAILSVME